MSNMKFIKTLSSGTYGHTSLFLKNGKTCIVKISKTIDFRQRHEFFIMKELKELKIPNFCLPVFLSTQSVPTKYLYKGTGDPLRSGGRSVYTELCGMEYIDSDVNFETIIADSTNSLEVVFSIIKQVLCAISIAYDKIGFTHYDLHTDNIMIEECEDEYHDYLLPSSGGRHKVLRVPLYRRRAKIIDFGFSTVHNVNRIASPIMFPQYGYTSNVSHPTVDVKVFLVSIVYELERYRMFQFEEWKHFRNIVVNLFYKNSINLTNGWNNAVEHISYDGLISCIEEMASSFPSNVFCSQTQQCMDILQYGIQYPLKKATSPGNLKVCFDSFIHEWNKFDTEIGKSIQKLAMLKHIIMSCVAVQDKIRDNTTMAIEEFKILVSDQSLFDFLAPKNVDYKKLLISLLLLFDCIENVLYADYILCTTSNVDKSELYIKNTNDVITILIENGI
jgi:serine/threonine protein kinase